MGNCKGCEWYRKGENDRFPCCYFHKIDPWDVRPCEPYEDDDEQQYTPSSTYGDYSPSNPWDAPGMSIWDFI